MSIPDDKHDEFQQHYATANTYTDRSVTLSELPPDGAFPMFFKITHMDKDGLTIDGMLELCSVVVSVLSRYCWGICCARPTLFYCVCLIQYCQGVFPSL